MTLFDWAFILLFLSTVSYLVRSGWAAIRMTPELAKKRLRRLGIIWVAYWAVLIAVSLLSDRRILKPGEDYCSDDWCMSVTGVSDGGTPAGAIATAAFRLSSRARAISQREKFVAAYAITRDGQRLPAHSDTSQPPFDSLLGPLATVTTRREFPGAKAADIRAIEITREGGLNVPGCCIIGDDTSFLHKRMWFVLVPGTP
ncbi:MAG: hypothetical protein WCP29_18070 [Acidobacteriota bacterium]